MTWHSDTLGKRQGKLTEWYDHGQKAREGQYVADKESVVWTAWHQDGEKAWQCTYVDGKIRGKKTYWALGTKTREDVFDDNGVIAESTTWTLNGARRSHGTFKAGQQHGRWTLWEPKGAVLADGEWRDGKPWEGTCAMPVAGDAGSVGGIQQVGLYREGKLVKAKQTDSSEPSPQKAPDDCAAPSGEPTYPRELTTDQRQLLIQLGDPKWFTPGASGESKEYMDVAIRTHWLTAGQTIPNRSAFSGLGRVWIISPKMKRDTEQRDERDKQ